MAFCQFEWFLQRKFLRNSWQPRPLLSFYLVFLNKDFRQEEIEAETRTSRPFLRHSNPYWDQDWDIQLGDWTSTLTFILKGIVTESNNAPYKAKVENIPPEVWLNIFTLDLILNLIQS